MTLLEQISYKIRELRKSYNGGVGLSQEELAKSIGVTTNTVSRWETTTYKPSIDDLEKIARFFCISILEFFPQNEDDNSNDRRVVGLMRAAKELPDEDIEELRRYAEFRKARFLIEQQERPQPGRKRKG